ncbi:MAG: HAMP domain-containing histidine kinase [Proteobacteria bacterium]|nr:HAMP domain-containing histidine kinase [Pseudomonadota bacterium]
MQWLKRAFQAYVDSFDSSICIAYSRPSSHVIVLLGMLGITLASRYVPFVHGIVGLRNAFWPILVALLASSTTTLSWFFLPERKRLVALFQMFDCTFYGLFFILLTVLSNPPAAYVFACFYVLCALQWGSQMYAFSVLGVVSCTLGPIVLALFSSADLFVLIIFGVGAICFVFTSKITGDRRKQAVRNERSEDAIKRVDSLLKEQKHAAAQEIRAEYMGIFHELKNLVGPVMWNLEAVCDQGSYDSQAENALLQARTVARRLGASLERILEAGCEMHGNGENFILKEAVQSVYADGACLNSNQAKVVVNGILNLEVSGSRENLELCLNNLIGNAIEAGAKKVTIESDMTSGGTQALLSVSDTGPGIPKEVQGKLFAPFVTHGKETGVGLGLYLSRRLLEARGASLRLLETSSKGTCFGITLPVISAHASGEHPLIREELIEESASEKSEN